jgi:hypothetical protein
MNDEIVSSRLLDLILEKKANNHVGSRGINCHWTRTRMTQCKLVGDADNARVTAHGVD